MKIETKYNVGDKVYALHEKICKGTVELVKAVSEEVGRYNVVYHVRYNGELFLEGERHLFSTKEELLTSLEGDE